MNVTYEQAMNMLFERTADNRKQLQKQIKQRRNGMEDLYGVMFSANGDADSPASFYISLSPDYVYLERFAFKLVIKPFATTVKGATSSATVQIEDTSLSVSDDKVSPNPHNHTAKAHTHNIIDGMAFVNTTSEDWEVWIDGVDITDYLIEQHDGYWIDGEGVYPTNDLDDEQADFYDILDVASLMTADGNETDREKLLRRGFKKVEIKSDAPFAVDAYLYVKYSHMNR